MGDAMTKDHEDETFDLSYAQSLRVGWFFAWRWYILGVFCRIAGMLLGWIFKYRLV
jgi:hypothetical protein